MPLRRHRWRRDRDLCGRHHLSQRGRAAAHRSARPFHRRSRLDESCAAARHRIGGDEVKPSIAAGSAMSSQGVGARVARKEDDRLVRGRGEFVADIRLAGMKDVAFVRSPLAHARIRGISIPPHQRASTFTAADLVGVKPIRAVSGLRGFKVSEQPPLATDKVRHVGELVAMCMAATRADAEDLAASVTLELEELPAVYDMLEARKAEAALVHEHWADNVFLETFLDIDIGKAVVAPIEGRGVVGFWDTRLEQLTVYSACQMPHIVRTGLSECLGLDEGQVRII